MKSIVLSLSVFFLAGSFAFADGVSETAPKKSSVAFTGSIATGMLSDFNGNFKDGANSNSIGAYTNPTFNLTYKQKPLNVLFAYDLTAFGGQGFGSQNTDQAFGNNIYFEHEAFLRIIGTMTPKWKAAMTGYFWNHKGTGDQAGNETDVFFQPSIERKLNDKISVAAAYYYERDSHPDGLGLSVNSKALDSVKKETDTTEKLKDAINSGIETTSEYHTGKIIVTTALPGKTKLKTYVRAGKIFKNKGNDDAFTYRLNSDLTKSIGKNLSLFVRYRLNLNDNRIKNSTSWYNMGRVIADYTFTKNWGVHADNISVISQGTDAKTTFENLQYLGVTYSF